MEIENKSQQTATERSTEVPIFAHQAMVEFPSSRASAQKERAGQIASTSRDTTQSRPVTQSSTGGSRIMQFRMVASSSGCQVRPAILAT